MVEEVGEEMPAALLEPFLRREDASLVVTDEGTEEFSSWRGRLFAAAVSKGGGCGRSFPVDVVLPLLVVLKLFAGVADFESAEEVESIVTRGT